MYLLDTDIKEKDPVNRLSPYRLFTGDDELRLRQEIVLGIGRSYVLEILCIRPSIIHLNKGHPAFALLERIREQVSDKMSFEKASKLVRETSVSPAHIPIPAGHDAFPLRPDGQIFLALLAAPGN